MILCFYYIYIYNMLALVLVVSSVRVHITYYLFSLSTCNLLLKIKYLRNLFERDKLR